MSLKKYQEEKLAAQQEKKKRDLDNLTLWQKTRDPQHLEPLVTSFEPVLVQKMRQYKAPAIPEAAFKAELTKHLIGALDSYDPNRGAALGTHVENRMRKAMRYNARYQNVAHIPEGQIDQIAPIQQTQQHLYDQFGRAPTAEEVAMHMGKSTRVVQRVLQSQRKDIPASSLENDPQSHALSRDAEVLSLLPHSLKDDRERQVFHHLYGDLKENPPKSLGVLAKQLGLSNTQISRIHSSILDTYKKYK